MAAVFLADRSAGTDAARTGFPLDDAWIHLVYARSLARLDGFAYNPGVAEAGFTSPLWALLLTPTLWAERLGIPLVATVKALGLALGWAGAVLTFEVVRSVARSRAAAWAAALLVAVEPWLGFARLSGMEVSLAMATALLAVWAIAEDRVVVASVALALAGWARPENAVLVALAVPVVAFQGWRRTRARGALLAIAPATLAAVAWIAFCLTATGRPLPNTFYAKHQPVDASRIVQNVGAIVRMIGDMPAMCTGAGLVLLAVGVVVLTRRALGQESLARRAAATLLVLYPIAFLAAVAWAHTLSQPAFYWHRYLEPAFPFLLIAVGIGVGAVVMRTLDLARSPGRGPLVRAGAAAVALAAVALPVIRLPGALRDRADLLSWNCENINEVQVALGRWLARNVPPGELIAAHDAGAIRFFGEHPVVDLFGLNTHAVLDGGVEAGLALGPSLLVVFPAWLPGLDRVAGMQVVASARARRYTICDCPEQEELVVFRPPAWMVGRAAAAR